MEPKSRQKADKSGGTKDKTHIKHQTTPGYNSRGGKSTSTKAQYKAAETKRYKGGEGSGGGGRNAVYLHAELKQPLANQVTVDTESVLSSVGCHDIDLLAHPQRGVSWHTALNMHVITFGVKVCQLRQMEPNVDKK